MVVKVESIEKRFNGKTAITSVSFEVNEGEIFVLVGPNGAGKTTTLRCIAGEIAPDSGHILVFGKRPPKTKERIGVLTETRLTFSKLTPIDYEDLASLLYPHWNRRIYRELILHFGIPEDRAVEKFSAGMKTSFYIALLLGSGADLLILDEPTQNLDPSKKDELLTMLRQMGNKTLIIATHQLDEVEWLATSFAIINEGRTVYADTLEAAKEKHRIVTPAEAKEGDEAIHIMSDGSLLVKTGNDIGRYPSFYEIAVAYLNRSVHPWEEVK